MTRFLLSCCLAMIATSAFAQDCVVNDPTGTPLNIRTQPQGSILGALHNGVRVQIVDTTYDENGKAWAYIIPLDAGKRGWVFRAYLACE